MGCSTGESLALSLLSPSNSGPSAKGQPCQIPDLNHGTAATPLKSDFMPWKRATPLEQSHALPPLPSQARARSRAAASARSRVRDGSCCARCTLGQPLPLPLETDHATAPAPYRKTGAAHRREVLNCRQSIDRMPLQNPRSPLLKAPPNPTWGASSYAADGASHRSYESSFPESVPERCR